MLLTFSTLAWFSILSVGAIAIGMALKRQEVYIFGVLIMFFLGLMIISGGIAEASGQELNESTTGNVTSTVVNTTYTTTSSVWTTGFGLLFIVIAAGLSLQLYKAGKEEDQKKHDSIEVED